MPVNRNVLIREFELASGGTLTKAEAYIDAQLRLHFHPANDHGVSIQLSEIDDAVDEELDDALLAFIISRYESAGWMVARKPGHSNDPYLNFR